MRTARKWVLLAFAAAVSGAADAPPPPNTPPSKPPPVANVTPPPNIVWSGLEDAPPASPPASAVPQRRAAPADPKSGGDQIAKLNAWTLGLAGGQRQGVPLEFATDISRVVDDGDNLHVLPIVTRGPEENVEALLYLKCVDAAIINADTLQQFTAKIPDIQKRISYIVSLFPSELQILARPEINTIDDLRGKKVNFSTPGTAAAFSGPLIFGKLNLDVQQTFIPNETALDQMRAGTKDMAAVVFVTPKPVDELMGDWPVGFKLLPVPFQDAFYQQATLTAGDYPGLIQPNQQVATVSVPTILAAYNAPMNSERYKRIARLVDNLFDRINLLQGIDPKWKDVLPSAYVAGLPRLRAAQDWVDKTAKASAAPQASAGPTDSKLFQEFLQWRKTHQQ